MTPLQVLGARLPELEVAMRDALAFLGQVDAKLYLPAMADLRCTDAREDAIQARQCVLRALELIGAK